MFDVPINGVDAPRRGRALQDRLDVRARPRHGAAADPDQREEGAAEQVQQHGQDAAVSGRRRLSSSQCARKQDFKGKSPAGTPYKIGCIFEPYDTKTLAAFAPTALGGNNWPPMSYDPNTHAMYVCESQSDMSLGAIPTNLVKPYVGGEGFTNVSFGTLTTWGGTISALDVPRTGSCGRPRRRPRTAATAAR